MLFQCFCKKEKALIILTRPSFKFSVPIAPSSISSAHHNETQSAVVMATSYSSCKARMAAAAVILLGRITTTQVCVVPAQESYLFTLLNLNNHRFLV